jgi:hypothetical protein
MTMLRRFISSIDSHTLWALNPHPSMRNGR